MVADGFQQFHTLFESRVILVIPCDRPDPERRVQLLEHWQERLHVADVAVHEISHDYHQAWLQAIDAAKKFRQPAFSLQRAQVQVRDGNQVDPVAFRRQTGQPNFAIPHDRRARSLRDANDGKYSREEQRAASQFRCSLVKQQSARVINSTTSSAASSRRPPSKAGEFIWD